MSSNYYNTEAARTGQQIQAAQYKRMRRSQKAAEARAQACGRPRRFPNLSAEQLRDNQALREEYVRWILANADYWIDKRRCSLQMVTAAVAKILDS